jgi:predicted component of type VI protein secretion system
MLETEIRNVINNYEPRATIQTLTVTPEESRNLMYVYMEVFISNNTTPTAVNLILQRSR